MRAGSTCGGCGALGQAKRNVRFVRTRQQYGHDPLANEPGEMRAGCELLANIAALVEIDWS